MSGARREATTLGESIGAVQIAGGVAILAAAALDVTTGTSAAAVERRTLVAMGPPLQPRPSASTAPDGSGDVIFYAAALGSFCGTAVGGLIAARSHIGGLQSVNPLLFACIVLFGAAGVGGFIGAVWDDLIEGRLRGRQHGVHNGTLIVAVVSSAIAAMVLILDAPRLAVPVAVLAFVTPVLWLAGMLLWAVVKRRVLGR